MDGLGLGGNPRPAQTAGLDPGGSGSPHRRFQRGGFQVGDRAKLPGPSPGAPAGGAVSHHRGRAAGLPPPAEPGGNPPAAPGAFPEFAERPFPVACAHCRELAAQYASCAPLLLQLGSLFLNYLGLAGKPQPLLQEALALFSRAQEVSQDAYLCKRGKGTWKPIACCVWTALREAPSPAWGRIAAGQALQKPYRPWPIPRLGQTEKPGRCFKWASTMPFVLLFNDLGNYLQLCQEQDFLLACRRAQGLVLLSQWNASTLDWCSPLSAYGPRLDKERREKTGRWTLWNSIRPWLQGSIFPCGCTGMNSLTSWKAGWTRPWSWGITLPGRSPSSSKAWCAASQRRRISPPAGGASVSGPGAAAERTFEEQ